jgi:hypothetical protein
MNRYLLSVICLVIAVSPWIVRLLLKAHKSHQRRERAHQWYERGYLKGFEDAHLWWIKNGREVEQVRQKIREEEQS